MAGGFIEELKRRHVFRAAVVYLLVAWGILQLADIVVPALRLPDWAITLVLALLVLGLPLALVLAWAYDLTPDGLRRAGPPAESSPVAPGAPDEAGPGRVYEFGAFRLDVARRELTRAGEPVELQPRVFDLLVYLVEHRDAAVSKQQLQDAIWSGVVVTEASLTRAVMKLRQAVGDDAGSQSMIKTLHGHGYRFVAPIEDRRGPADVAVAPPAGTEAVAGKPSTRWWLPLSLAALALVAVTLSIRYLVPTQLEGTKVAVLPVVNETGEPDLAWTRLGLMSLVSELIGAAEGLDVVPDTDVVRLAAETEPGRESLLVERLRRAYAATHVVALTLERSGGMLRLTFRLRDPDGREVAGTMLDEDPTALARGAARSVVSEIGGQARMRQPSELIQVKLGNQSRDGIYIETDRSLEPGANVSIKMVSPEEDRPESAYLLRDGRVVWCQKVNGGNHRFGAGIKILRKVVQADVLTSRFR
jgi:DNA-binding winged helix-turn-helix (wHTH) protein/TolB-like protein